jgi:CDP-diacylglycerol--glycerol-3-phosphate 3-phosphatidyltransferase
VSFPFIALVLFLVIALSDALDGMLARRLNQVSSLGKFLDPLADKILVIAVLIVLVEQKIIPALPVIIIVARDLTVSLFRGMAAGPGKPGGQAAGKGLVIAANRLGKIKTVLEMLATIMLLLALPLAQEALWLAAVLSVLSGLQIVWDNKTALQ